MSSALLFPWQSDKAEYGLLTVLVQGAFKQSPFPPGDGRAEIGLHVAGFLACSADLKRPAAPFRRAGLFSYSPFVKIIREVIEEILVGGFTGGGRQWMSGLQSGRALQQRHCTP